MKTKRKTFRMRDSNLVTFLAPNPKDGRSKIRIKVTSATLGIASMKQLRQKLDKVLALAS